MSVSVMALVWGSTLRDRMQVDVLNYLANCSDDEGGNCFPSIARIAHFTRCSQRTVKRTIKDLEALGFLSVIEGRGRGIVSLFVINVDELKRCQDVTFSQRKKVTAATGKGDTVSIKGDIGDIPPHPLNGRTIRETSEKRDVREERALPPSLGTGGELMAATWLLEELGLAGGPYDVRMLGQVIRFAARDAPCEVDVAAKMLLEAARAAVERCEVVNVFWFKDRRFAMGGKDGEAGANQPSKTKRRIDGTRRAIAEELAKRGVSGPWSADGEHGTPVAAGGGGLDRDVHGGHGAAGDPLPAEQSVRRGPVIAHGARPEVLPPAR